MENLQLCARYCPLAVRGLGIAQLNIGFTATAQPSLLSELWVPAVRTPTLWQTSAQTSLGGIRLVFVRGEEQPGSKSQPG